MPQTNTPNRPFELAWIPPGSAAPNLDQYVEHPDHQLDALRGILYGRNAPGWAGATVVNHRNRCKKRRRWPGWSRRNRGEQSTDLRYGRTLWGNGLYKSEPAQILTWKQTAVFAREQGVGVNPAVGQGVTATAVSRIDSV